jgi:hypothetical protein
MFGSHVLGQAISPNQEQGRGVRVDFPERGLARQQFFIHAMGAFALLCTFLTSGCVATAVHSTLRPGSSGKAYSKVLVNVDSPDLADRSKWESTIGYKLSQLGVEQSYHHILFFPGESHSADEVQARMKKNGIQAMLTMKIGSQGTKPESGLSYATLWANFEARLMNADTGVIDWMGSATSRGREGGDLGELWNSAIDKFIDELRKSGMLARPK